MVHTSTLKLSMTALTRTALFATKSAALFGNATLHAELPRVTPSLTTTSWFPVKEVNSQRPTSDAAGVNQVVFVTGEPGSVHSACVESTNTCPRMVAPERS